MCYEVSNITMATATCSFANDQVEYPYGLVGMLNQNPLSHREFFAGSCACCYAYTGKNQPLSHCSGCQLLAYCSKECQKMDWLCHKPICKLFPVKNGVNVLSEAHKLNKDARKLYIKQLTKNACDVVNDIEIRGGKNPLYRQTQDMFYWGRVCNICKEARVDKLTDCICHCVSYCSETHRKADKAHKEECNDLLLYARTMSYFLRNAKDMNLPMNTEVDKEYQPLTEMEFNVSSMKDEWLDAKLSILSERLSYPLTILYALQESGLGTNKSPVENASSLSINVVSPMPMLDSGMWEFLMHRLPNLNEMHIVFIGRYIDVSNRFNIDITNKLERCTACKLRKRLITYSIYLEHYEMYFSSMEYIEPDVIAVFNYKDLSPYGDNNFHSETSYLNMTYDEDTLIILTDSDCEKVKEGIQLINEARPVDVVMPAICNPFRGFGSVRTTHKISIINDRDYMACVRRK
ncbi:unnamed protein product [Meganyctiphanes norvegica]|uniref:MYND-type domain-containing protein n=1 Tax=Meganyctiphanes norvegica TaxID=48144 RepID=A0AAV2R5R2_MEGNR